jgi:hypothetical protein
MKAIARACLKLVILAIPVTIAACYGMMTRYNKRGYVIDKQTRQGIDGVEVKCILSGGAIGASNISTNGAFDLYYDTLCDHLEAEEAPADGAVRYKKTSVPFDENSSTVTIEMEKI